MDLHCSKSRIKVILEMAENSSLDVYFLYSPGNEAVLDFISVVHNAVTQYKPSFTSVGPYWNDIMESRTISDTLERIASARLIVCIFAAPGAEASLAQNVGTDFCTDCHKNHRARFPIAGGKLNETTYKDKDSQVKSNTERPRQDKSHKPIPSRCRYVQEEMDRQQAIFLRCVEWAWFECSPREKMLPVVLGRVDLPLFLRGIHTVKFCEWQFAMSQMSPQQWSDEQKMEWNNLMKTIANTFTFSYIPLELCRL